MTIRNPFFLALLLLTACSTPLAPVARPQLSARAVVHDDPAQRHLQFSLESNLPLSGAQLSFGADGGRAPIDVPLTDAQTATYQFAVPNAGLRLPRDVNALRYSWILRGMNGEMLTIAQSITSTQFALDDSPLELTWQAAPVGDITLYYLPDTPAARDSEWLKLIAADRVSHAANVLDAHLSSRLSVYLLPRIFWQGGAAFGDKTLFISYADRAYTGVTFGDYLAHESAHALTQDWGNLSAAGGMLAEGIAVYATGGHYQPDRLDESAATLQQSALFITPQILRRDFSNLQHEIAYTESGSFVKFLIEQYGLEKFRALIRRPNDWRTIYGKDFDALAQEWLTALRSVASTSQDVRRWPLKVRYYDVLRQYEERLDPDARRLPSMPIAKWDDTLRRAYHAPADGEDNRVLELMMLSAVEAIEVIRGDEPLAVAENYLDEVERKIKAPAAPDGARMQAARAIVRLIQSQDRAVLNRDWDTLRATLDAAGYPQFAAQFIAQADAQPAWLRFAQSPVRLIFADERAWLTVAQWAEPLDLSQTSAANGQRWVLALRKINDTWRVTGRWPDTPAALTAR